MFKFYVNIANKGIKNNSEIYLPYIFATSFSVMMCSIIFTLLQNSLENGRQLLSVMLMLGVVIVVVFSLLFIFYGNKFLIKRRVKEIGLYTILGLEKKHIAALLFFEFIFCFVVSLLFGVLGSLLFGKLFFLILGKICGNVNNLVYKFNFATIYFSAIVFFSIFLLNYLYNAARVSFLNPIQLLKEAKTGKKKTKVSIVKTLLGVLFLGGGYCLSLITQSPVQALKLFLPAVVLVMLGTMFLFNSVLSFALSKMKNRKSYYKPQKFIFISGMIYRLGQNSKGLSNICILLTMVFITVATTFSIHKANNQTIDEEFARENKLEIKNSASLIESPESIIAKIKSLSSENEIETSNFLFVEYFSRMAKIENNECVKTLNFRLGDLAVVLSTTTLSKIKLINVLEFSNLELKPDEIIVIADGVKLDYSKTFKIGEMEFTLKKLDFKAASKIKASAYLQKFSPQRACIIFSDNEQLMQAQNKFDNFETKNKFDISQYIFWDSKRAKNTEKQISDSYPKLLKEMTSPNGLSFRYKSRYYAKIELQEFSGSFLFLGMFLSLLFLLWLLLVMYFKQITEGYEDRRRYKIMRKIGMSEQIIKNTSRQQLLWIFLLPVSSAVVHCVFGSVLFTNLLLLFRVVSKSTFLFSLLGTVVFVSALYSIFYFFTSRQYGKIINRGDYW